MAVQISALTAASAANLTDAAEVPVSDAAGNTRKATFAQVRTALGVWEVVGEQELAVASATIDFTGIAATWDELELIVRPRGDTAAVNTILSLRINNDSGANYDYGYDGLGVSESVGATNIRLGEIPAGTASAGAHGYYRCDIPNYSDASRLKNVLFRGGADWGTAAGNRAWYQGIGKWRSAAAINRLTLALAAGNFAAGSIATLRAR